MSAYSDKVIADGAAAYWRLGETSGTVARSEVGSYNGTISGGVTLNQPGALADGNKAMAFDGTTGKIAGVPFTMAAGAFSVEAWVKSTTGGTSTIFSNRSAIVTGNILVQINPIPYLFVPPTAFAAITPVNDGNWHHVVVTYNGTTAASWFIDGVLNRSAGMTSSQPGTVLTYSLGWDQPNGQWFSGSLDDVAIYPTALTPAQIANHYALATINPSTRRRRFRAHAV